jgi:transposase-like protein
MPKKNPRTTTEPITLQEAIKVFADPDFALEYAVSHRWPDGVKCPTCGSEAVIFLRNQRKWKCGTSHTRRQFSVKVGTIMEDSPMPLQKWLPAIWMASNCKNGISSYELARALDITQKSAWFMLQRIRLAMQNAQGGGTLDGTVEVDETYVGGAARFMHQGSERHNRQRSGRSHEGKAVVMGLLQRANRTGPSKVRAAVIPNVKRKTLKAVIAENVKPGAGVYSDAFASYVGLNEYEHKVIDHAVAYVQGQVHTNGMENFWSLLKRAIKGTYVSVEPFHLFRYVDEQAFRFNERKNENGDRGRFKKVLRAVAGKRLTYKELIAQDEPSVPAPA